MEHKEESELRQTITEWIESSNVKEYETIATHNNDIFKISISNSIMGPCIQISDINGYAIGFRKITITYMPIVMYAINKCDKIGKFPVELFKLIDNLILSYYYASDYLDFVSKTYVNPKYISVDNYEPVSDLNAEIPKDSIIVATRSFDMKYFRLSNRTIHLHRCVFIYEVGYALMIMNDDLCKFDKTNQFYITFYVIKCNEVELQNEIIRLSETIGDICNHSFVKGFKFILKGVTEIDIRSEYNFSTLLCSKPLLLTHKLADPRLCKYIESFF